MERRRVKSWPLPHTPNPNPPISPQKEWDDMTWDERACAVICKTRALHSHGVKSKVRKRVTKVRKPRRGLIR